MGATDVDGEGQAGYALAIASNALVDVPATETTPDPRNSHQDQDGWVDEYYEVEQAAEDMAVIGGPRDNCPPGGQPRSGRPRRRRAG